MSGKDKIIAKGLTFKGCHGVLGQEKDTAQIFKVDAVIYADLKAAAASDDIEQTIDYAMIYGDIKAVIENNSYNLIETLADKIANLLLNKYPAEAVEVCVYKPNPPLIQDIDYFAVSLTRKRD
ncbi:MAG: dihydroneopterin aldolase [Syntrophomonadaceae bacterium]|jgi:dihydroneopterin aldolase|nr:dihydroneopterin aldolase [Syntrophomonadaceae bacterium]